MALLRRVTFLSAVLHVALVDSLPDVSGYLGDDVTLSSGADPSWKLSSVHWSILSNNTLIATYRNGKLNIDRVSRYKGRLSLDTDSGDLKIYNVTAEDTMDYTVDLINTEGQDRVNKIRLTVKQRLRKPTTQTIACKSVEGRRWIWLQCSSADKGVDLSWKVTPPDVTHHVFNHSDSKGVATFLTTTQDHAEFTCTSSQHTDSTSTVVTPKCDVVSDVTPQTTPTPKPPPHPPRWRHALVFFSGLILGFSLAALFILRAKITAAWRCLRGKPQSDNTPL